MSAHHDAVAADVVRVGVQPSVERAEGATGSVRSDMTDGRITVVPDEARPYLASGVLDKRLFDVSGLIEQGIRDELPLIVTHGKGRAATPRGTETVLLSQTVSGVRYTAGTPVHLRFRAVGSGTTTLQGRVWFGDEAEPSTWQIQTTDSTAALQAPGGVGVHHYLSGSATNAPIVMSVDDLIADPVV